MVSMFIIETQKEVLRFANITEYRLSLAIFTEDLRRGPKMAKGIEASAMPYGGAKNSRYT
jgi:acyl-CoA reductase-like NAD-dependent aldehyde dehydrogenase